MQRDYRVAIVVWMVCFVGVSWKYAEAQSLDGSWEITAVVDDGRVIDPTNVLLNYAADGRVIVNGQTVQLIVPMTYQRKQLVFTTDTTKSPMTGAARTL